jgi:hypothetical protein
MSGVKFLLPLGLALLCSFALAADKEAHAKPTMGVLAAAPAGGDAKVLGTLKVKDVVLNVIAANDEVAAKIKELVTKSARVAVVGEKSADGKSITVSKIEEAAKKPKEGH